MSFSPQTGLVYIPHTGRTTRSRMTPRSPPSPLTTNLGICRAAALPDPRRRQRFHHARQRWRPAHRVGPDSTARGVARRARGGANGGVLSTAGGLVFQGIHGARRERKGLWSTQTQTVRSRRRCPIWPEACSMSPSWLHGRSWAMSGAQANAKGTSPNVSRCSSTRWEGTTLPHQSHDLCGHSAAPPPPLPRRSRGEAEYRNYCGRCHGPGAVNFGILPDLRYSAALGSKDTWAAVVLGGVLKANGMASFAECSTRPRRTPSEPTSSRRRTSGLHLNAYPDADNR